MTDSNYELSISRYIAAKPDDVWAAMTERLPEWWCPTPWRAEVDNIQWCSGGAMDTTMYGPDGEVVPGRGIFLDVIPGKRFVFTDAINADMEPQQAFMIGIFEIAAEGEGTRYTASSRHWNEDDMARHKEMGFHEGWTAAAAQLARLVE